MSEVEYFSHFISDGKGKLLEIPQRRGKQDGVFVDWISFTFHEDTLLKVSGCPLFSDAEYMYVLSRKLEEILGFGITRKCKSKGNKFYDSMFRLGSEEVDYGEVHYGGQRNTVLIELKGVGCNIANPGWELRLKQFLEDSLRPRITRVDLALDFFDGEYTPEQALLDHDNGFFDNSNQRPKSETIGTAWRNEDGSGKTFYVGRKKNSRFVRVYEKGRQLGDKESKWVRFEIQFNYGDIEIPLDILINQGSYFCGAFPICRKFKNMPVPERFDQRKKTLNLTFEHKLHYAKNAVGKLVNFMIEMGFDNSEIVESLKADSGFPKGLEPEKYALEMLRDGLKHGFIHEQPDIDLEIELDELGVIAFKNSDKFDREKRLFSPDYDAEKERKYQDYLDEVYHQNVNYDYF
ncbi:replication initiation factor domain-containing protein [Neisseria meningitidis]|uniref:replication initiation factor domain-containing protein n=1 Tax=Neisseria meningitidis TaxID=487 RepID=UPI000E1DC63F|nr:replication initiation factor domain-containing protein [Neisseria meningitidis]